ncbi:TPA: hypothetical protein QCX89_005350 [Bacillus cereus]|nr:hypothetical protein [Bacillus cereus]
MFFSYITQGGVKLKKIRLTAIQMQSNQFGWAGIQYSNDDRQAIVYTKNSGQNWIVVNPLNASILSIYPVDINSAWVYGLTKKANNELVPTLFYTNNKGDTWNEILIPVTADWEKTVEVTINLHTDNTNSIWVIISRQITSNTFEHNFYATQNRGQSWTTSKKINLSSPIIGITFINPSIGFISTQKNYKNSTIYKTLDGGATWNPVSNIHYPNFVNQGLITSYKPIYKGNILIIPTKIVSNLNSYYLNISYDKGNNWLMPNKILNTGKAAISFFNSNYGWVVDSDNGGTYKIGAQGQNWIKVSNSSILIDVFCLRFFNSSNGWACNHTQIFKTTNGGDSWISVPYVIEGIS